MPQIFEAVKPLGCVANEVDERGWVDRVAGMPIVKIQSFTKNHSIDVDLFLAESAFQLQLLSRRRRAITPCPRFSRRVAEFVRIPRHTWVYLNSHEFSYEHTVAPLTLMVRNAG